jgi:hypothetical protein
MTYYPDMGTVTMVAAGPQVRAIGWLSRHFEFPTGSVSKPFVKRLHLFAASDSDLMLNFPLFMGSHECEFCKGKRGGRTFGVPAGDVMFVAPKLVAHYVEQHQYYPPREFVDAVMNSPMPGSQAYLDSIEPFKHLTVSGEDRARMAQAHAEERERWWRALEEDISVRFPVRAEPYVQPDSGEGGRPSVRSAVIGLGLAVLGIAIGAVGIYIGDTDDAPGAALIGILLMVGAVVLGVKVAGSAGCGGSRPATAAANPPRRRCARTIRRVGRI